MLDSVFEFESKPSWPHIRLQSIRHENFSRSLYKAGSAIRVSLFLYTIRKHVTLFFNVSSRRGLFGQRKICDVLNRVRISPRPLIPTHLEHLLTPELDNTTSFPHYR